jgi:hypothetical protein
VTVGITAAIVYQKPKLSSQLRFLPYCSHLLFEHCSIPNSTCPHPCSASVTSYTGHLWLLKYMELLPGLKLDAFSVWKEFHAPVTLVNSFSRPQDKCHLFKYLYYVLG